MFLGQARLLLVALCVFVVNAAGDAQTNLESSKIEQLLLEIIPNFDKLSALEHSKLLQEIFLHETSNGKSVSPEASLAIFRIERGLERHFIKSVESVLVDGLGKFKEFTDDVKALNQSLHQLIDGASGGRSIAQTYAMLLSLVSSETKTEALSKLHGISTFERFVKLLITKLTTPEAITDLRTFIGNLPQAFKDTDFGKDLTEILDKATDKQIGEFLRDLLSSSQSTAVATNNIFDWFTRVKSFFKSIGSSIKSKFSAFGEWAKSHWTTGLAAVKDKFSKATALAKEFILSAHHTTKKVAKQALEYFKAHKLEIAKSVFKTAVSVALSILAASG